MTGISGTSKTGAIHNYYTCNGRKKKLCKKKNVTKDYIEDMVVDLARAQLTDENIAKIAAAVADICEKERDSSNANRLKGLLRENEKQKANILEAVKLGKAAALLLDELERLEKSHAEIEKEVIQDSMSNVDLSQEEIRFFLSQMRDGDINDENNRRLLITVLINRIYLYDDKITVIFNASDMPVEITQNLIDDIEAHGQGFVYEASSSTMTRRYELFIL